MTTTTFASTLLDAMEPWLTPAADPHGDHATYLRGLAAMFEPTYSLVADQGDDPDDPSYLFGYAALLDVDLCPEPFLPWLAMFVGAEIPVGTDEANARQIIRAESAQQRGSPASIISAVTRFLTGSQSVTLLERTAADGLTPDAYHFVVLVRLGEVIDVGQLTAAVDTVRPAGVFWTLVETNGWDYNQALHTYSADAMTYAQSLTTQP